MPPISSDEQQRLVNYATDLDDAAATLDAVGAKEESDVDPNRLKHGERVQVPGLSTRMRALAIKALQLAAGGQVPGAELAQDGGEAAHRPRPMEVDRTLAVVNAGRGELRRIKVQDSNNPDAIAELIARTNVLHDDIAVAVGRLS